MRAIYAATAMRPFCAKAFLKIDDCLVRCTGLRLLSAKVKGQVRQELMLLCGELLETPAFLQGNDEQRFNVVIEYLRENLSVKPQLIRLAQMAWVE